MTSQFLTARPIIERESRRQIGDGLNNNIWKDKWISVPSSFRVFSPKHVDCGRPKNLGFTAGAKYILSDVEEMRFSPPLELPKRGGPINLMTF